MRAATLRVAGQASAVQSGGGREHGNPCLYSNQFLLLRISDTSGSVQVVVGVFFVGELSGRQAPAWQPNYRLLRHSRAAWLALGSYGPEGLARRLRPVQFTWPSINDKCFFPSLLAGGGPFRESAISRVDLIHRLFHQVASCLWRFSRHFHPCPPRQQSPILKAPFSPGAASARHWQAVAGGHTASGVQCSRGGLWQRAINDLAEGVEHQPGDLRLVGFQVRPCPLRSGLQKPSCPDRCGRLCCYCARFRPAPGSDKQASIGRGQLAR